MSGDGDNGRNGRVQFKAILPLLIAMAGGGASGYGASAVHNAERFVRLETQMVTVQKDMTQQMLGYQGLLSTLSQDLERRVAKLEGKMDIILERLPRR